MLENLTINGQWCLVHATHVTDDERQRIANSGATVGLCPVTEADLGDGIFDLHAYLKDEGRFGIGTDSNVRISLSDELRLLEYTQRLHQTSRSVFAGKGQSSARRLFSQAVAGGAQALARNTGELSVGKLADLLAIDYRNPDMIGHHGDHCLDAFVFGHADRQITDVWSAGRHVVHEGQHYQRAAIVKDYVKAVEILKAKL